jgi:hypothetical protein
MEYNLISAAWNVQYMHACLENTSVSVFQRLAFKESTVNFSILCCAINDSLKDSFLDGILQSKAGRLCPNLKCQHI